MFLPLSILSFSSNFKTKSGRFCFHHTECTDYLPFIKPVIVSTDIVIKSAL